jgi:hypothetical protein
VPQARQNWLTWRSSDPQLGQNIGLTLESAPHDGYYELALTDDSSYFKFNTMNATSPH